MKSFPINKAIRFLKKEVKQWRVPVVGHYTETPFTVVISCLLSLRTQDKVTDAASERLFRLAKTPQKMGRLSEERIQKAIYPVCFYRVKARTILKICAMLVDRWQGRVPNTIEELLELPGVGRKTANLTVTLGFRKPGICVDTHVHRICNRWGYVKTKTPDETEMTLRKKLPKRHWMILNDLLVAYGQNLCKPVSPLCSQCCLSSSCARRDVTVSR